VAEGDGLLNADQHFGHPRFSSQILAFQSLPRSRELAAVGSRRPDLARLRDNRGDSPVHRLVKGADSCAGAQFQKETRLKGFFRTTVSIGNSGGSAVQLSGRES
jgi:hypothetical protein